MNKEDTVPRELPKEIPFDLPQFRKRQEKFQRMEKLLMRFLDPEELGLAVTPSVRDDVRIALGGRRIETDSPFLHPQK